MLHREHRAWQRTQQLGIALFPIRSSWISFRSTYCSITSRFPCAHHHHHNKDTRSLRRSLLTTPFTYSVSFSPASRVWETPNLWCAFDAASVWRQMQLRGPEKRTVHAVHVLDRIRCVRFPRSRPFRERDVVVCNRQQMQVAHIIVDLPG